MGEIAAAVRAESEYLTQLDAAIGDGDHGINMNRGFDAVGKALAVQDGNLPPGQLLTIAGKTLVSTVGGASGPLWGTAFRRAGRSLGNAESFDGAARGARRGRRRSRGPGRGGAGRQDDGGRAAARRRRVARGPRRRHLARR